MVDAQYNLGICYENGDGVSQSYSEAAKWYQKAAEQGMVEAQFSLALCYAELEKETEALMWLKKAAQNGHKEAISVLKELE